MWRTRGSLVSKTGVRCAFRYAAARSDGYMMHCFVRRGVFQDATSFNQDVSKWNTGSVTNMGFV